MNQTSSTRRASGARQSSLASAIEKVTKRVIGAEVEKPATIQLPQAVSEIHVSPTDMIPAGAVITPGIATEAGLDDDDIDALVASGHAKLVEVFAQTVQAAPEAQG